MFYTPRIIIISKLVGIEYGRFIKSVNRIPSMVVDSRKITGEKFTMTLPVGWRREKLTKGDDGEMRELRPGDYLDAHYEEGSALILIPKEGSTSEVEKTLIELLIKYPMVEKNNALANQLIDLANQMKISRD